MQIDEKAMKINQKALTTDDKVMKIDEKEMKIDEKAIKIDEKLPAACADRSRSSKSVLFKRILKKKRYFFRPGRSRPPAPTGPGAQNRYFLKGFSRKNDTFSVPGAPGRLPRPAPELKIDAFQKDF